MEEMRNLGMDVCHLDALADNTPAVRFYERCGFETTGETIVHYDDLGDVAVYLYEYDLKKEV